MPLNDSWPAVVVTAQNPVPIRHRCSVNMCSESLGHWGGLLQPERHCGDRPVCLTFKPALIHCSESISEDERDRKGWRGYFWKICCLAFAWSPSETLCNATTHRDTCRHTRTVRKRETPTQNNGDDTHVLLPHGVGRKEWKTQSRSFDFELFHKESVGGFL